MLCDFKPRFEIQSLPYLLNIQQQYINPKNNKIGTSRKNNISNHFLLNPSFSSPTLILLSRIFNFLDLFFFNSWISFFIWVRVTYIWLLRYWLLTIYQSNILRYMLRYFTFMSTFCAERVIQLDEIFIRHYKICLLSFFSLVCVECKTYLFCVAYFIMPPICQ